MNFDIQNIRRKIKQLKESRDGKILLANFAYLSLLQMIGYIFPLVTIPYLAKVIGVDGYGKIAFAYSVVVYFQTFVDWGFSYTAVRDIAKNKNNKEIVSKIFTNVLFSKFVLFGIATILFVIIVLVIPFLRESKEILFFTFLIIPGYMLLPDWFFQAMEEMKYITIMNICSKLIFTLLVFITINDKSDYLIEPLLNSCGMVICGIISSIYAIKKFDIIIQRPRFCEICVTIKKSTNIFISNFLPNMYSNFSVILLGIYGGPVANGLYSAGKKFLDITVQFNNVLSRTFFPFLARRIEKHNVYVRISGLITILLTSVLFFGADILVDIFYTDEFKTAASVIRILSIALFFLFVSNVYGTNFLVLKNKDKLYRNIIAVASICGFVFSFFAIQKWSYMGAALTTTFSLGIMGVLTYFFSKRVK